MTSTVPSAAEHTDGQQPPITMFGPDFPYAYDDYLAHPAGLGQIPATEHGTEVANIGGGLSGIVARTGAETTVVFDAHTSPSRPVVTAPRGVRVVFSPSGVIADDVLRQLVAAEPGGRTVVAVTSDRALATDLAREGARVVGSDVLLSAVTPG